MPNKIADHKKRLRLTLDKELIANLEEIAKSKSKTKSEIVQDILVKILKEVVQSSMGSVNDGSPNYS